MKKQLSPGLGQGIDQISLKPLAAPGRKEEMDKPHSHGAHHRDTQMEELPVATVVQLEQPAQKALLD